MLTIKQITENTDAVLRGLEKKHFKNAKETIAQVLDFNDFGNGCCCVFEMFLFQATDYRVGVFCNLFNSKHINTFL